MQASRGNTVLPARKGLTVGAGYFRMMVQSRSVLIQTAGSTVAGSGRKYAAAQHPVNSVRDSGAKVGCQKSPPGSHGKTYSTDLSQPIGALHMQVQNAVHAVQEATLPPKQLTAAVLESFYHGPDAASTEAKVAQVESSRMQYLRGFFETSDVTTVKTACAEYAKAHVGKPDENTAKNRAKEARQIYGAWRFCKLDITSLGYKKAYERAIVALKEAGIKWDNSPILTPEQQKMRKAKVEARKLVKEAATEAEKLINKGVKPEDIQLGEMMEQAAQKAQHTATLKIGIAFCKRVGVQQFRAVVEMAELIAKEVEFGAESEIDESELGEGE